MGVGPRVVHPCLQQLDGDEKLKMMTKKSYVDDVKRKKYHHLKKNQKGHPVRSKRVGVQILSQMVNQKEVRWDRDCDCDLLLLMETVVVRQMRATIHFDY